MFFLSRISRWLRARSREIYEYHDGDGWRRADPVVIGTRLEAQCPEYMDLLELLFKKPSEAPAGGVRDALIKSQTEAAKKLAEVSRNVFGLKSLTDTEGVTDGEAIRILTGYFVLMHELAENASLF